MNSKTINLKKGIVIVLVTNIINTFFSIITGFILPKFLSKISYSQIKTFQLYVSYIGLFHFGFIDGIYLKYGGKSKNVFSKNDIITEKSVFIFFQIIISLIILVLALFFKNSLLCILSTVILPFNMSTYYKMIYQATGSFDTYGKIMNFTSLLMFIINILFLFVFKTDRAYIYIVSYAIIYWVIWLKLEKNSKTFQLYKNIIHFRTAIFCLYSNIKSGLLLMIGNLASTFMTSMDRWFIKILMNTESFASYSFAVSMETLLNSLTSPIVITLYNFFSIEKSKKMINTVKRCIIVFSCLIISCAYPIKLIIVSWLRQYQDSLSVIYILLVSQIFFILIKALYVNLYKVYRKQKSYIRGLIFTIFIGAILNYLLYVILQKYVAFAIATFFSAIIWAIYCQLCFKSFKLNLNP